MTTLSIQVKPNIAKKLQQILAKQNNQSDFFNDFINYRISELEKANFNIEKDLRFYELKYNIKSNDFYKQSEEGKFGDDEDFMVWAGIYELYQNNKSEISKLI